MAESEAGRLAAGAEGCVAEDMGYVAVQAANLRVDVEDSWEVSEMAAPYAAVVRIADILRSHVHPDWMDSLLDELAQVHGNESLRETVRRLDSVLRPSGSFKHEVKLEAEDAEVSDAQIDRYAADQECDGVAEE